ncbi:hypothetical protein DMA11_00250 [Marinilabiliaceae bacterium JC017]|nr:hypothetical protein DMA11_00250 [Marinilabiliaceae bacterium JC017]
MCFHLTGQTSKPVNDTIVIQQQDTTIVLIPLSEPEQPDTSRVDEKDPITNYINQRASKSRVNKWLQELIVDTRDTIKKDYQYNIDYVKDYQKLTGKQIRTIYISQLDPFGTTVNDTLMYTENWFVKTGNKLRFTTSEKIIRKNLTFEKGDAVDPTNLSESERLLRQLAFISDAKILVRPSESDTSMVDVVVISQDRYPHAFSIGTQGAKPELTLYSRNMFGQGFGFSQSFIATSPKSPEFGFKSSMQLQNIQGSRIDLNIDYTNRNEKHELKAKAERSFYLSDMKYGGGLYINRSFKNENIDGVDQIEIEDTLNYFITDTWAGRAFKLNTANYFDQSNFYVSFQHMYSDFYDLCDSLNNNPALNRNTYYFMSLSFSKRNYYKNNLIYSYGRTEDVPYGFLGSLTFGYNKNKEDILPYMGGYFSAGKALIPNQGFFYFNVEANSFFRDGKSHRGVIKLGINYFSNLLNVGTGKLRNFVDLHYIKGFNRLDSEYIYLKGNAEGLTAFSNKEVKGKEKLVLNVENVFFTTKRILGFRMAAFSFTDMGFIGDGNHNVFSQDYYLSLGGGVRLRNDKLVFKTIQIRLAYMPIVPDGATPFKIELSSEAAKGFNDFVPGAPYKSSFK